MNEWQPIETAPKDGSDVLVYCSDTGEQMTAYWDTEAVAACNPSLPLPLWCYARWINNEPIYCIPTHWMPLPEPPK